MLIETKSLAKFYGLNPVLRGIDLQIPAGQAVGLLGSNGAGKTTLLRLLSTLTAPTAGSVTIAGYDLTSQAHAIRPLLGVVSHKPLLYDTFNAVENLKFYADLYNVTNYADRIGDLLEQVGLTAYAAQPIRTYSRGMQQRLAVARALLHAPQILLLDEPFTGLDQQAAQLLEEILLDAKQHGITILLSTHQLERAQRLIDRVVLLKKGKVDRDVSITDLDSLTAYFNAAVSA